MMGDDMKAAMKEYQNSLETMSSEAVEYIRGVPVVKTFGQTIFSFERFRKAIDEYSKWTIAYTKSMRPPMLRFTTAINAIFAIIIAFGIAAGASAPHAPAHIKPDLLYHYHSCDHNHLK